MIDTLNKGIYSKLNGNSAVTAALSSSTAIYFGLAPVDTVKPYIVYSIAGGGAENESPLDAEDVTFTVKAIAGSALAAGSIAGKIRTALHEQLLSLDAPWNCYRMQETAVLMYPETIEGKQFWHAGGNYRVRASK